MLFFSFSYSPGGLRFHPAQLLVPLVWVLLDGSLWQLLQALFGFTASQAGVPQRHQHQVDDTYASFISGLLTMIVIPVCMLLVFHLPGMALAARQAGWRGVVHYMRTGGPGRARPRQAGRAQQEQQRRPRVTMDMVADALRQLPTELHATDEQLQAMTVHELKERLQSRKVDCSQFLEKRELLEQLHKCGGSSATACSICCEEYQQDEPVRVLPCQHRYHLDCIDRWLLSSTDFSRPPACPLCNAELLPQPAQPLPTSA